MNAFTILGDASDTHAHYVAWALEQAGYNCALINSGHQNAPTRTSIYIDNNYDEVTNPDWRDVEAVWCRRLWPPFTFNNTVSKTDEYATLEDRRFTKWLVQIFESSPVRWINLPSAAQRAENKLLQLRLARSHGINVPRTLVTAEPSRFRTFVATEGEIVAKPLDAYSWETESGVLLKAFATVLDVGRASQLTDEDVAHCITMYQQRIDKVADIRLVVMGANLFAYKVLQDGDPHFDFRVGFYQQGHVRFEAVPIPEVLETKMKSFMEALLINFASADFALQADGEWIFLDLNPNGQWLFLEQGCSECRIGQKFCSFFVRNEIDAETEKEFPSFSEYQKSSASHL